MKKHPVMERFYFAAGLPRPLGEGLPDTEGGEQ